MRLCVTQAPDGTQFPYPQAPLEYGTLFGSLPGSPGLSRTVRLPAFDPVDARRAARELSWGMGSGVSRLETRQGAVHMDFRHVSHNVG